MSTHQLRRIAISTGGGDAPGLNAVIKAVVLAADKHGWECYGIRDGFNGILFPEQYPQNGLVRLTPDKVHGIAHLGGTILGTTNKGNPFNLPVKMPDGTTKSVDRSDDVLAFFAKEGLDALVSIGGDGSLTIADALHRKGLRVVGVPKTIDNDLTKPRPPSVSTLRSPSPPNAWIVCIPLPRVINGSWWSRSWDATRAGLPCIRALPAMHKAF